MKKMLEQIARDITAMVSKGNLCTRKSEVLATPKGVIEVTGFKRLNNLTSKGALRNDITAISYKLDGKRISLANLNKLFKIEI